MRLQATMLVVRWSILGKLQARLERFPSFIRMTTTHLGDRVPPKRTSAFVIAFSSTAFCSSAVFLLPMRGRYDAVALDERGGCVWRGWRLRAGGCSKGERSKSENPRKPRCIYFPLEQRVVKSLLSENLHSVAGRATFFFFLRILHR